MKTSEWFTPGKVLAGIAALLGAMFWPVLAGQETFYYRDFGVMGVPGAYHFRASLWAGEFPLWNPYSNCGAPFLAQWGTMVLYPLSLLYAVLPFPWSLNVFCLLHLWIGGAGMYFLARRWTKSDVAAGAGAMAFVFNGVYLASLTWPNYTVAVGLFPWVVYFVEKAWEAEKGQVRAIAIASVISAAQLLSGVPELSLFTWLLIGVLWIHRLVTGTHRSRLVWRQLAIFAATAGLVAAQILPFLELLHISQRTPGFTAEKWALPPWGWANLILPQFYAFKTPEGTTYQYGQAFLSSTYIGAPILILAVAGVLFVRNGRMRILAIVSMVAAVLALGSAGHLLPILKTVFPPIGIARFPVKFLYLLIFAVPFLAAAGYRHLSELDSQKRGRFLVGAAIVASLLFAALYWFNVKHPFPYDRLNELKNFTLARWGFLAGFLYVLYLAPQKPQWLWLPLLIVAVDSWTHVKKQNPTTAAGIFAPADWSTEHPQRKPVVGDGRLFITPEAEARLLESGIADPQRDLAGKRLAEWSHLNLMDGVPKVNGSSTLQIAEQAVVEKWFYAATNSNREAWLDFLNVTLQTSSNSVVEWQERPVPMPFVTGGQRALGTITNSVSGVSNFREQTLIENWENAVLTEATVVKISELKVSPHEINFQAVAEKESFCVIPQTWHPAWKAKVNETAAPVSKANVAFQAVRIPAGKSKVRVYYRDDAFRLGLALTLGTLLVLGLLSFRENARQSCK